MRKTGVALTLLLSGCANQGGIRPLRPLEIATEPYQEAVTGSHLGSLTYEGGCLLFRDDEDARQLMPVWPTGSMFNGTSVIFHRPGKADQPVVVGEEFVMSGRPVNWSELSSSNYSPFEHQCVAPPFLVSQIRPAN
jgi:hypothetical protein